MSITIKDLAKDTWVKVLENTTKGQVYIIKPDEGNFIPTDYLVTFVDPGDPAPLESFNGGIPFDEGFTPDHEELKDYYVKSLNFDGRVVVLL